MGTDRHPLTYVSDVPPDETSGLWAAGWCGRTFEQCADDDTKSLLYSAECDRVWSEYLAWCRAEGLQPLAPGQLVKVAKAVLPTLKLRRRADGPWCWCNVRINATR